MTTWKVWESTSNISSCAWLMFWHCLFYFLSPESNLCRWVRVFEILNFGSVHRVVEKGIASYKCIKQINLKKSNCTKRLLVKITTNIWLVNLHKYTKTTTIYKLIYRNYNYIQAYIQKLQLFISLFTEIKNIFTSRDFKMLTLSRLGFIITDNEIWS